jgi:hypothetical protein
MLLAKMKDRGLKLCVDYRAFNKARLKNRYPLLLISEMRDRVREARIFTKLDLRGAYSLIWIKEGDEYNTAFRTRYGHCEYRVMPFGLTNAPVTFQSYIDDFLWPYIDDLAVCYLDDILIYSTNKNEHKEHVRQLLQQRKEWGLYCKAAKCQFGVSEVTFLGCVLTPDGVGMEPDRISTIEDWPTPKSIRDVQADLGFTNFYGTFIRKYAKVTLPHTELLNMADKAGEPPEGKPRRQKSENRGKVKSEWTRQAELAFRKLKRTFAQAPIIQHFNPAKPIILQTDASAFGIEGILNQ